MIALSAGHYEKFHDHCDGAHHPKDAPSCSKALACEHALAVQWVNRVAYFLRQQTAVAIVPSGSMASKVRWLNDTHRRTSPISLAVEIHFNSCGGCNASGSETLYAPGSVRGKQAAEIVQGFLGRVFEPSRGIKEGWYRQDRPGVVDYPGDVDGDETLIYWLRATAMPALVVEPEFVHNHERLDEMYEVGTLELAMGIVAAQEALLA